MKKKLLLFLVISLLTTLAFTPLTSAFNDTKGMRGEHHIKKLKERGIIKGSSQDKNDYKPHQKLTYAQAAVLFDQAFNMSLAHIKFAKAPELTDIYPHLQNDAWYAESMIDAFYNGIEFPNNFKPNDAITREQFAFHLINQLDKHLDYALIEIYLDYNDKDKGSEQYTSAIQTLLILKFERLDKNNNFNPAQAITREEAAIWLENVLNFIEGNSKITDPVSVLHDMTTTRKAVSDEVDKITISATVAHPGYGAQISSIVFQEDVAHITVTASYPDPDMMYPQVITTIELHTFIAPNYKVNIITN